MAVYKHHWLVKHNFLGDTLFDSFKLLNSLLSLSQLKKTLGNSRINFNVLINSESKSLCRHLDILILIVLISILNSCIEQLADFLVAG